VELGCFDGKVLGCIEPMPRRYLGLDANWEGGLDQARRQWAGLDNVEFRVCKTPAEMPAGERFDAAICMETLEHLSPEDLAGYLDRIRAIARGRFYVTVPNEIGIVCVLKQLAKMVRYGGSDYSGRELVLAGLGLTAKIARNEHKGFNYFTLLKELRRRFRVERVDGIPFRLLPAWLNFTVGMVLAPEAARAEKT
jgi:SAM-dependent methyltransferase